MSSDTVKFEILACLNLANFQYEIIDFLTFLAENERRKRAHF